MIESCNQCHEDDKIDHVTQDHDSKDDPSDDDLESTCSSISFEPSIPDEDINFDLVYALHSFAAVVTGQASVIKGDALILMDDSNSYWWLVEVLKTRELGYIPAENTETPFERLARLNKHRNVDITAPNNDDLMDPMPRTTRPKNVTLGPEDEYQTLVFERDDDGDDFIHEDFDDYDYEKDDYGCDIDYETNSEQDENTHCTILDNEPVDQLTAVLGSNTSASQPLEDDSDEDDMDTFEDAQQDFSDTDGEASPKNGTFLDDTYTPPSSMSSQETHNHNVQLNSSLTVEEQPQEINKGKTIMAPNIEDRTGRMETLRVFGGNITKGLLFHTFDIVSSTTAHELLTMAIERFNLDVGFESIEYYLSVQGLDGDDYILLAQDKPLPIFRTLTASLTTPMPRSSMEQQQQIAKAKERLSTNEGSISNRRRSTSFSNYEQTYHDEDSLIRFYLHQRIKRGRAGLLYIKVCLCRGGVGQKRNSKNKNKEQGTIDRMEKIMAVQVDSQVGMVINEALAKFNVPDATAENFLGGLGDVRLFTKYRMSVRTNNDIEMPLQATQDMATLLNLLQINWNVGERTLLTNDLLFMLFPSGGIKKGQQRKGSRDHSQDYHQQERRPSILDILMDSPCTKETSSQQQIDQGNLGVDSPIADPLALQQKTSLESNWNPCSPSSIPISNHQRRSSLYSTISDSSSIPDSLTDDMTFGFNSDKRSTPITPKSSSFRQHFKRWVGWGPKKTQQQQQQQQQYPPTNHHPLNVSSSCLSGEMVDSTLSSCTLTSQGGDAHLNSSVTSVARSISSHDHGARRSSNCTTESTSSNLSRMEPVMETASHSSNNATLTGRDHSGLVITNETRDSMASSNTSLPASTSNLSIAKPPASIRSETTCKITLNSPTAADTEPLDHTTNDALDPEYRMASPPSWDQGTQDGHRDSLVESDISSLSNSSSDLDSTMDEPSNAGGNDNNNQSVYEWFSDSDNEDSDTEGGQHQSTSRNNDSNEEPDDIMAQYSTWMKRASLDATSIMNEHTVTPPKAAPRSPSVVSASSSSTSGDVSLSADFTSSQRDTTTASSDDSQSNSTSKDQDTYFSIKVHQPDADASITTTTTATSAAAAAATTTTTTGTTGTTLPSTSLDIDALLLVTHGVDFLKNRESSNWEDDDAHFEADKDRYAFHPWTRSDKSSDVSSILLNDTSPPLSLSTTTSVTAISHGKKPSTVTPSPTSSTATIIVPNPKVASIHQEKKLGGKEEMDDELHRIVSMHVLF